MAKHLSQARRRPDRATGGRDRGDLPIMTVVVMLLGTALVGIGLAAASLAGHAVVAQSRLRAYNQATSLGESALSVFYAQLEANPRYFSDGGAFPGADGKWHVFEPDGSVGPCPDVGGVPGLSAPGGPGCWALQVEETTNVSAAGAGGAALSGNGQPNQAATVTAYSYTDCHGATLVSCTSGAVVQHLNRRDFLDFLYFTNQEVMDPAFAGSDLCSLPGCSEPAYYTGDVVYGPVHTNAPNIWVCGSPTFESRVEATGSTVWQTPSGATSCAGSSPVFNGGTETGAPNLPLPASDTNSTLVALAGAGGSPWPGQPGYSFTGNITVVADGSTLDITANGATYTGVAFPSTGVISASGDIYAQGTVSGQLTLDATGNVYVTGSLTYTCSPSGAPAPSCPDYTGLVAGGGGVYIDDAGQSVTVDAAMLALAHSVSINPADLKPCSGACPTLHLYGAMAAEYRGVFGAYSGRAGASTAPLGEGFQKDFHYDARLYHASPPWMLSGQTGGWERSAPAVVGAPSGPGGALTITEQQAPPTTTTSTTTTTVPKAKTPPPLDPPCPSATELASGVKPDSGNALVTLTMTTCRSVPAGTPVLVGISTFNSSPSGTVTDSAGNSYNLIASEPGVYLYASDISNTLAAGSMITVTAAGNYGVSAIAEAMPGITFTVDGTPQSGYAVGPPVSGTYSTTWTKSVLLVMAAGGTDSATASPSTMSEDQVVAGVSTVFADGPVTDGNHSFGLSWPSSGGNRSWMALALAEQGATPALNVSSLSPSPALPGWQVTITGTGFGAAQGSGYVHLADLSNGVNWGAPGNSATFTVDSWSDTSIVFTVPTPSGSYGVWRVNPGDNVTVDVHNSYGQTSNKMTLGISAPSCMSSTNVAQGSTSDNGAYKTFSFLTCRAVAPGTPVLVAVYTANGGTGPTVNDNTGDPYNLVAWKNGVYLYGTTNPNGLFADEVITVQAQGDWGIDAIAEAAPSVNGYGVTLTVDGSPQGGYMAGSPINASYRTTMTEDDLLFLAAGGWPQASITPSPTVNDQVVNGMSGVFSSRDVSYGTHGDTMSWGNSTARSWMVVALVMQGAQPSSSVCPSSTDVGQGSTSDPGGSYISFNFPVCRSVPAGTPVLVGIFTGTGTAAPQVTDSNGNPYQLVAWQNGVYLYGTTNPAGLLAGNEIGVSASSGWGTFDAIAEAVPGVSFTVDATSGDQTTRDHGYAVGPPINTSYTTTMTQDDLIFMAAGGWEAASVSPSSMATDQIVTGVSGVFAQQEVGYGAHALGMNWAPSSTDRSWMAVALVMQGATLPPPQTVNVAPADPSNPGTCLTQTWTVPPGVYSVNAQDLAGTGGQAYDAAAGGYVGGGIGGSVSGTVSVQPGNVLDIYSGAAAGLGNGGCGYGTGGNSEGGGGGGSSAIVNATTGQLLMVAGAGGGALSDPGMDSYAGLGYYGGGGYGNPNGGGAPANGDTGNAWTCEGGAGGAQSGPGVGGGAWWNPAWPGTWDPPYCSFSWTMDGGANYPGGAGTGPGAGNGGVGGNQYGSGQSYGGGGGAGYYGGGGGGAYSVYPSGGGAWQPYAGPGGGGSSWTNSSYVSNVSYGTGPAAPYDGSVSITYTP